MSLGNKLLKLRKEKNLSQEEVADKLNVTRQSVSKWETDQSTPDFDKIAPLCELYGITADELVSDKKREENFPEEVGVDERKLSIKKANGICIGILLYFVAVAWMVIAIPYLRVNPLLATPIFLLICGIATYAIIYTGIVYKKSNNEVKKSHQSNIMKQITGIVESITLIIYLMVSFMTGAWHITWIMWIVSILIIEIIKLIFTLRGNDNE